MDEWINKMYMYTYTHNGYYSPMKKKEILPLVTTGIDLEGIMLNEICQTETNNA